MQQPQTVIREFGLRYWFKHAVDREAGKASTRKTKRKKSPFLATILGDGQPYARDEDVATAYLTGNADDLALLFLRHLQSWARVELRKRNLLGRRGDLVPELVDVGAVELVIRSRAIVGRNYTVKRVRNSLRQSCRKRMRIFLDQLPVAAASSRTLRDRREKTGEHAAIRPGCVRLLLSGHTVEETAEALGCDRKVVRYIEKHLVEYRHPDMPDQPDADWSGYFAHEPVAQQALYHLDENENLSADRWLHRFPWSLFEQTITDKAVKLAMHHRTRDLGRKLRCAITYLVSRDDAEWNPKTKKWADRSVAAAAQHAGIPEHQLRKEMQILARQVAESLRGLDQDHAREFLGSRVPTAHSEKRGPFWAEILEIPPRIRQNAETTAIGIYVRERAAAMKETDMVIANRRVELPIVTDAEIAAIRGATAAGNQFAPAIDAVIRNEAPEWPPDWYESRQKWRSHNVAAAARRAGLPEPILVWQIRMAAKQLREGASPQPPAPQTLRAA